MSANHAKPACFKAYDIRGRVPAELDEDLAYRVGLSTARYLDASRIVVGRDCRLSSASLVSLRVPVMSSPMPLLRSMISLSLLKMPLSSCTPMPSNPPS